MKTTSQRDGNASVELPSLILRNASACKLTRPMYFMEYITNTRGFSLCKEFFCIINDGALCANVRVILLYYKLATYG